MALVASLALPGGNITGFAVDDYGMGAKWVELLTEIAPSVTHVGVIRDPTVTVNIGQLAAIQAAARSFALEVSSLGERDAGDIERTVTEFAGGSNRGLITAGSPLTVNNRDLIISLAARRRLPIRARGREGWIGMRHCDLEDTFFKYKFRATARVPVLNRRTVAVPSYAQS
jgi:putative tryptophan/tyrosine transport system substrate-binding protein